MREWVWRRGRIGLVEKKRWIEGGIPGFQINVCRHQDMTH